MTRYMRSFRLILLGAAALGLAVPTWAANFEANRIFIEYNQTDNDLGYHVFLDAEDWEWVRITNPNGDTIFYVEGQGPYIGSPSGGNLGLSELFTEGAEPTLDDFPLDELLELFPEGKYKFTGITTDGKSLTGTATLSHAVPAGPEVFVQVGPDDTIIISWNPVTEVATNPAAPFGGDFPNLPINIVGYQVIVDPFQVTLPANSTQVTLPPEFVQSLKKGDHSFEVLAIDKSGNQTITESSFETP